jgi:hypothetical protein
MHLKRKHVWACLLGKASSVFPLDELVPVWRGPLSPVSDSLARQGNSCYLAMHDSSSFAS